MYNIILSLTICLFMLCSACCGPKQEINKLLLSSSNYEQIIVYAEKARCLGLEGIPIFLKVISLNIEQQYNVAAYGKLVLCNKYLNEMAKEGIFSKESVPVLFNLLENQINISDSRVTAETLEIITGVTVGYDIEFVESYTPVDEPKRKAMIAYWKSIVK